MCFWQLIHRRGIPYIYGYDELGSLGRVGLMILPVCLQDVNHTLINEMSGKLTDFHVHFLAECHREINDFSSLTIHLPHLLFFLIIRPFLSGVMNLKREELITKSLRFSSKGERIECNKSNATSLADSYWGWQGKRFNAECLNKGGQAYRQSYLCREHYHNEWEKERSHFLPKWVRRQFNFVCYIYGFFFLLMAREIKENSMLSIKRLAYIIGQKLGTFKYPVWIYTW